MELVFDLVGWLIGVAWYWVPIVLLVLQFRVLRRQKQASRQLEGWLNEARERQDTDRSSQPLRRLRRSTTEVPETPSRRRPGRVGKTRRISAHRRPRSRLSEPTVPITPEVAVPFEPELFVGAASEEMPLQMNAQSVVQRPEPTSDRPTFQPPPPPAPRRPSHFEAAAKEILVKIWNWIAVGEEHRPSGYSMEYAVASTWLLRVGIVILVMGIGFFLRYSIDKGWIAPTGRVALAILIGVGLLVAGIRLLGTLYHLLGQALIGGGIATLYFSIFAAVSFYHLIGAPAAFGLMALITVVAGAMAVRFDSLLIALLGSIGGYGTPVLLSTGEVNFVGFFAYMLLLGCGILGISLKKNWHLLNYVGFACTYGLFAASMRNYSPSEFWHVMPFLTGFFVLYSTTLILFNVVQRTKSTLLELIGLLLNAGIFFVASYLLVREAYGQRAVAAITLGLTAFYAAHVYYFLVRRIADRELMLSFMGLSVFFLAVTIPLVLSREWITVSWAIQALVMLWLAEKLTSAFLRQVAFLLYGIILFRFGFVDLAAQYSTAPPQAGAVPLSEYFLHLLERVVVFGVPISSMAGAYLLLKKPLVAGRLAVDQANDVAEWVRSQWAMRYAIILVLGMGFLFLHLELNRSLNYLFAPGRLPVLTLLWLGMCLLLLYEYRASPSRPLVAFLALFIAGTLVKLVCFDLPFWNLNEDMVYGGQYSVLDAVMRLVDFGAMAAFFVVVFAWDRGTVDPLAARRAAGWLALGLAFVFLTLELNTALSQFVPALRAGGVSILWSLFALGLIVAGIHKHAVELRLTGLGLFTVVGFKIFFSDLAHLDQFYRIVAFILLGVLILSGAFLYLKYQQTFASATPSQDHGDMP